MKKILILLSLVMCSMIAQSQGHLPGWMPFTSKQQSIGVMADSLMYMPVKDTNFIPQRIGAYTMRPQDSCVYVGIKSSAGGKHWEKYARLIDAAGGGIPILVRDSAWMKRGNAATNENLDFEGTLDEQDFRIRTNNIERMKVVGTGNVQIKDTVKFNKLSAYHLEDSAFEIAIFPDLQNMIELHQADSRTMFKWLADSAGYYNVKAMLQVGDITNRNTTAEWDTLKSQLKLVTDARPDFPFLMVPGNHDYANGFNPASRQDTNYNKYLGASYFAGKSFYGGHYPADTTNENYWIKFTAGNVPVFGSPSDGEKKYVVLGLEFLPRDAVVTWASNLLDSFAINDPKREVIIVTHAYQTVYGELATDTSVYSGGTYGMSADNSGQELWDKLIKLKKNIRWVFSGHFLIPNVWPKYGLQDRIISTGVNGNLINQIMVNYQDDSTNGDGYFLRLKFYPNTGQVAARFYSTVKKADDPRLTYSTPYTLYDPSLTVATSMAVEGDATVGRDLRVAGELKNEKMNKDGIAFIGDDHIIKTVPELLFNTGQGVRIKNTQKDSAGITITRNTLDSTGTPFIKFSYGNAGQYSFQIRGGTEQILYGGWNNNVFMGDSSGAKNRGAVNAGYGSYTLTRNINGDRNFAAGSYSQNTATGSDNTTVGTYTMLGIGAGGDNTVMGSYSLTNVSGTVTGNSIFGNDAWGTEGSMSTSSWNTIVGKNIGRFSTGSPSFNTIVGARTATSIQGSNNLILSPDGGATSFITGTYNVLIGGNNAAGITGKSKWVQISDGFGNIKMVMDSVGNIGIGTVTPTALLHVNGANGFRYVDGNQGVDKIMRSDANGVGSWVPTSSLNLANTSLSNLASVSINASLIPQSGKDLGAAATPWKDLYLYGSGTYASHSMKFTGTPTGNRVYTFQNRNGTIADNTDLALKANIDDPIFTTKISTPKLKGSSSTPTISNGGGGGAGSTPTYSITGTDVAGEITITTDIDPNTNDVFCRIEFNVSYTSTPYVVIYPSNDAAALLYGDGGRGRACYVDATTDYFRLMTNSGNAPVPSTEYKFMYHVIQ